MKCLLLLGAVFLFGFSSCKKSNGNSMPSSYITFNVAGQNVSTNDDITVTVKPGDATSNPEMDIDSYSPDHNNEMKLVIIFMNGTQQTGSYPVDYSNNESGVILYTHIENNNVFSYASGGQASYAPGYNQTGNITITQISNSHVQGTFQGLLDLLGEGNNIQTVNVINGKFNVKY